MPTIDPLSGVARFDVHDATDLAYLVKAGMIWRSGPKVLKIALDAIRAGDIARPTRNVRVTVDAYLDRAGVARTQSPDQSG